MQRLTADVKNTLHGRLVYVYTRCITVICMLLYHSKYLKYVVVLIYESIKKKKVKKERYLMRLNNVIHKLFINNYYIFIQYLENSQFQ